MSRIRNILSRIAPHNSGRTNYKFVVRNWVELLDLKACAQVLETKRFSQNLRPVAVDCPAQTRILVLAPHPDDDTFGAGGTIIKAVARGARVNVIYLTRGQGEAQRSSPIRDEAIKVCQAMGVEPAFLGLEPRGIPLTDPVVNSNLSAMIKRINPQAIFITFLLDDHDDHRRVNQLLMAVAAELELSDVEIWAYQIYSTVIPNVVVDITAQADRKRELIRMWSSVSGERDWAHYVLGMNAANCRYLPSKEPVFAEAFFVVQIDEYLSLCRLYFANPPERIYYSPSYLGLVDRTNSR